MKWRRPRRRKKPKDIKVIVCISRTLSLCFLCYCSLYICTRTHTNTEQKTSQNLCPKKEEWFCCTRKMLFTLLREKIAKRCFLSFGWKAHQKKISFWSSVGPRKKNLFHPLERWDESKAQKSLSSFLTFTEHHFITMAASSLTAAALGSKVALHKVRKLYRLCSLVRVLSFFILSYVRARRTERDGER